MLELRRAGGGERKTLFARLILTFHNTLIKLNIVADGIDPDNGWGHGLIPSQPEL
jgi:hypothetical protein